MLNISRKYRKMSPLKSDTTTTTTTNKSNNKKKQSKQEEIKSFNKNEIIADLNNNNNNNNNNIPTPPIIKVNRKYSRLSLNSSYESLADQSRSCSSNDTSPARSR
jgi:hypothetical protein